MANGDECKTEGCEKYSLEHSPYCIKCEDAEMHPVEQKPVKPEPEAVEPVCVICKEKQSERGIWNKKQGAHQNCVTYRKKKAEKTEVAAMKSIKEKVAKKVQAVAPEIPTQGNSKNLLIGAFKIIHDALAQLTGSERERVLKAVDLLLEENYGADL